MEKQAERQHLVVCKRCKPFPDGAGARLPTFRASIVAHMGRADTVSECIDAGGSPERHVSEHEPAHGNEGAHVAMWVRRGGRMLGRWDLGEVDEVKVILRH